MRSYMNPKFHSISLAVGGAHYPTVNTNLQQQFGEALVVELLEKVAEKLSVHLDASAIQALCDEILADYHLRP